MTVEPRYLLDTNICIYLLDDPAAMLRDRLAKCDRGSVVTSAISYAEVMVGAGLHRATDHALSLFEKVPPQPFDRAAADVYATLPFRRGSLDRLIGSHARALELILVTNNERDFADILGLVVENWTL